MKVEKCLSIDVFIIFVVSLNFGIGVKINRLEIPDVAKYGSPVVLDCDYKLDAVDEDLVLKWYFNHTLVYQWIPDVKNGPQALERFKIHLNLGYAIGDNAYTMHRALYIVKAVPELSGDYVCSVSTMQSEDVKTKSMLVLVPGKELLKKVDAEYGMIKVECLADDVYPMPLIIIESRIRNITETDIISKKKDQLFEVSATVTLPVLDVPEVFSCTLLIPQANYSTRKEIVFYPGRSSNLNSNRWFTVAAYLISTTLGFTITYIDH